MSEKEPKGYIYADEPKITNEQFNQQDPWGLMKILDRSNFYYSASYRIPWWPKYMPRFIKHLHTEWSYWLWRRRIK